MEYNKNDLYRNGLNYGLILALSLIIFTVVLSLFQVINSNVTLLAQVTFTSVAIVFGNKNLRDNMQGGFISYGRSLGSGTYIGFIAGIAMALFTYLFYGMISPESLETVIKASEEQILQQGIPEEQLDMAMSITRKLMTPSVMAVSAFFNTIFWAFLSSLVISAVLKRNPEDEY